MKPVAINPWPELDPEKEARKHLQASRRRQYLEDLADILKTPAGLRLITAHLRNLRLGQPVGPGEGAVTKNNIALALLRDCGQASPAAHMALLQNLFAPEDQ